MITGIKVKRHLAKTVSYRIVSTSIGFLVIYATTGSLKISGAFSAAELLFKPIIYFFHERIWYKWIKYGLIEK